MQAGRWLDALIATQIMGWSVDHIEEDGSRCELWRGPDHYLEGSVPPPYSTDIKLAWQVLEKLREKHWLIDVSCHHGEWCVKLDHQTNGDGSIEAATAPHAICLAALGAHAERLKKQQADFALCRSISEVGLARALRLSPQTASSVPHDAAPLSAVSEASDRPGNPSPSDKDSLC